MAKEHTVAILYGILLMSLFLIPVNSYHYHYGTRNLIKTFGNSSMFTIGGLYKQGPPVARHFPFGEEVFCREPFH